MLFLPMRLRPATLPVVMRADQEQRILSIWGYGMDVEHVKTTLLHAAAFQKLQQTSLRGAGVQLSPSAAELVELSHAITNGRSRADLLTHAHNTYTSTLDYNQAKTLVAGLGIASASLEAGRTAENLVEGVDLGPSYFENITIRNFEAAELALGELGLGQPPSPDLG